MLVRAAAFLAALALVSSAAGAAEVQWFGHSALRITTPGGKVILVDPFITRNPVTPEGHKDPAALGRVDLVLVTHGHGDHVGDTSEIAETTGAKVAVNADLGRTLGRLGLVADERLIRFNKGGSIRPLGDEVTITMVRAEHSSEVVHEGRVHPGGEPVGFVIAIEGDVVLYHAGDTGVFGDMALIRDMYAPDVAFLPIGGHYTMDPAHAAYAVVNLLKTETVVPIHYGTTPVLTGTPEAFAEALGDHPARVVVMEPGEIRKF